jgi:hypothetical protein
MLAIAHLSKVHASECAIPLEEDALEALKTMPPGHKSLKAVTTLSSALAPSLFAFAGIWRRHQGPIKKDGPSVALDVSPS